MVAGQELAWDTRGMGEMMIPLRASICTGTPSKREHFLAAISAVLPKMPVDSLVTSACPCL